MSERGVFAVDRGVFDHPIFAKEPFTEREAWMWLVGAAAWKPMRIRAGRATVELERGQCAFASRFLAKRFQWSEARVRRFLKRLETDAMVTTQPTHETTRITICNYDKYAFGRRSDVSKNDAPTDEPATHSRRKEEEINNSKKQESIFPSLRDAGVYVSRETKSKKGEQPSPEFLEFWKSYPKREGSNPREPARKKFELLRKSGVPPASLVAGARAYADEQHKLGKIGTQYIAQAVVWLNQRRDLDYVQPIGTGPPTGLNNEERAKWVREQMEAENAAHAA